MASPTRCPRTWAARARARSAGGRAPADAAPWRGPTRRYDILKEGTIAAVVVLGLTVLLAALLSSPDVPSATVASWAKMAPADFLATAATELNGTSGSATYGPPYNNGTDGVQSLLFAPAKITGITQPINAAQDFVTGPLGKLAPTTRSSRRPWPPTRPPRPRSGWRGPTPTSRPSPM